MSQPLKKQQIIALFGSVAGNKLLNWLDTCCDTIPGVIDHESYLGNDADTEYSIPAGSSLAFVSTDGRVNDPATEYTYDPVTGIVSFVGAPSLNVVILIFFQ